MNEYRNSREGSMMLRGCLARESRITSSEKSNDRRWFQVEICWRSQSRECNKWIRLGLQTTHQVDFTHGGTGNVDRLRGTDVCNNLVYLADCHASEHAGQGTPHVFVCPHDSTGIIVILLVRRRFHWPGLSRLVSDIVTQKWQRYENCVERCG